MNAVETTASSGVMAEREACRDRFVRFSADCETGVLGPADTVRKLNSLFAEMARNLSEMRIHPVGAELEQFLNVGSVESAAIRLTGSTAGFLMSRSPCGTAMASVWIPDRSEEHTIAAMDCATALCGALALACAQAIGSGPEPLTATVN